MPATSSPAKRPIAEAETPDTPVRERILQAAVTLMGGGGFRSMSQAKVAAAAGVRQSHVTYYFPKRADLIVAMLAGHIEHADKQLRAIEAGHAPRDMSSALDTLLTDTRRMRFFLALLAEADQNPKLQAMVEAHMAQFQALVAAYFGRPPADPDVELFLNTLRGFGMRALVSGVPADNVNALAIAGRFGLSAARAAG